MILGMPCLLTNTPFGPYTYGVWHGIPGLGKPSFLPGVGAFRYEEHFRPTPLTRRESKSKMVA